MIIDLLEDFRILMQTGSDDTPVMDPLKLEHLHLDLDDLGMPGSHLSAQKFVTEHLSSFVLDEVTATLTSILPPRYRIIIDGHIPVIEVDADTYDLSVHAMGSHIFANGQANIRLIEPRIRADIIANIGLVGGISVSLHSAHVTFKLKAFEPNLTGMFGDDLADEFINVFLAYLVPELVDHFEEEISKILSDLLMEVGSDLLPIHLSTQLRRLAAIEMIPTLHSSGEKSSDVGNSVEKDRA